MAIELYRSKWVIISMPTLLPWLCDMDGFFQRYLAWRERTRHTWTRYL
jgi:hypothetical protein